jgi:hypothetical protein
MLVALVAAPAGAALVVHDNAGLAFTWTRGTYPIVGPTIWGAILDPTLPAAAQTGAPVSHGFAWMSFDPITSTQFIPETIGGYGDLPDPAAGHIARSPSSIFAGPQQEEVFPPKAFEPGQSVGGSEDWRQDVGMGYSLGFQVGQGWFLGDEGHVGIRFTLASETHYGWIRLKLVPGIGQAGHYQPVAWAYETTPGTPALVPAPAAGLLGLAMAAAGARRRRA